MNIPSKLELYADNKLSGEERIKFEKDLADQPELAHLYKAYCEINKTIQSELQSQLVKSDSGDPVLNNLNIAQRLEIERDFMQYYTPDENELKQDNILMENGSYYPPSHKKNDPGEIEFRTLLNTISKEKSRTSYKSVYKYFAIAAALLLSFFAGKLIYEYYSSATQRMSPQEVFALYYNPSEDAELISISNDPSGYYDINRSDLDSAFLLSKQQKILQDDYEKSLLFLGIIQMERKNIAEARKCFLDMLSIENSAKINIAYYYLSLIYLSEGSISEAFPLLLKLSETNNPYKKKARAILHSLKLG
jgi:hypothetical protein